MMSDHSPTIGCHIYVRHKLLFPAKILLILSSIVVAASCTGTTTVMYSGPVKPAGETALIRGADTSINIVRCDGVRLSSNAATVLPGEHTVEVAYEEMEGYFLEGTIILGWEAEAGHTYIVDKVIHAPLYPGMSSMFITDQATKKKVSTAMSKPGTEEQRLRMFERKIKEFPQSLEFRLARGYLLMTLKRYREAFEESGTCISMNSDSVPAWVLKSGALYELGQYDESLNAITKAIQLAPDESGLIAIQKKIRENTADARKERLKLKAAYGEVISGEPSRLIIQHITRPRVIKEEYDSNGIDISAIKTGDKVYIEYIDGKPRQLKLIEKQN